MMDKITDEIKKHRKPFNEISPIILNRWSPRSMTGAKISDDDLMSIFEAARWAPSAYNEQPWRFIYAKRDTGHFETLFNLMVEFNQSWTKNAAVLIVIISSKNFTYNNKPSITNSFDTGAAWENMALEASSRGLVMHGMSGIDYEKAQADLEVPNSYNIEAMAAIGVRGKKENLPKEMQDKEFPSDRKPSKELIMEGKFKPD